MKATFDNTVSILVKAYFDGTLVHSYCGCAVHNIIEAINGKQEPLWYKVFCTFTSGNYKNKIFLLDKYKDDVKKQIDSSGYSLNDLAKIEYAFELNRELDENYKDVDTLFECLMEVVNVLAQIHNIDRSEKESAKKLFDKVTY